MYPDFGEMKFELWHLNEWALLLRVCAGFESIFEHAVSYMNSSSFRSANVNQF